MNSYEEKKQKNPEKQNRISMYEKRLIEKEKQRKKKKGKK